MYTMQLAPKTTSDSKPDRPVSPADVRRHAQLAGVKDHRFEVKCEDQALVVYCEHRRLIELLHRCLGKWYYVDPVEQLGFDRRRLRVH